MTARRRIAIVGGGIAGLSAAHELAVLARQGANIEVTLFEASSRLGGIVETVREEGFTIECGPDAWVTEKPWARALAEELGLGDQIIRSNDATRKTYVLLNGGDDHRNDTATAKTRTRLVAMPDRMRMMVPAGLAALAALEASRPDDKDDQDDKDDKDGPSLFSPKAVAAFRAEVVRADWLRSAAPEQDESVASFILRHFGHEVLEKIGAPLLSGVFGGDVARLSVRAVMAPFVAMEREYGSLILALEAKSATRAEGASEPSVFTTLRTGLGTLIDCMVEALATSSAATVRLEAPVTAIARGDSGWRLETASGDAGFDRLLLAAPVDVAQGMLARIDPDAAALMQMEASSAVVVAFGFAGAAAESLELPPGFGFLVPPRTKGQSGTETPDNSLLAATFVDQKFPGRVPAGGRLIRAFFGGETADRLLACTDEAIADLARRELSAILGPLPAAAVTVVRRWPRALPQYAVGHLERMAILDGRVQALGNLWLLGNGYRGVGLPDLVRDARAAARQAAQT